MVCGTLSYNVCTVHMLFIATQCAHVYPPFVTSSSPLQPSLPPSLSPQQTRTVKPCPHPTLSCLLSPCVEVAKGGLPMYMYMYMYVSITLQRITVYMYIHVHNVHYMHYSTVHACTCVHGKSHSTLAIARKRVDIHVHEQMRVHGHVQHKSPTEQ